MIQEEIAKPAPDKVKGAALPITKYPVWGPTCVGVNVSGTLNWLPGPKLGGVVIGEVSVKGPEVLIELIVPLALPELIMVTIKLLVLPTFAQGNVMVPPGETVTVGSPVIRT